MTAVFGILFASRLSGPAFLRKCHKENDPKITFFDTSELKATVLRPQFAVACSALLTRKRFYNTPKDRPEISCKWTARSREHETEWRGQTMRQLEMVKKVKAVLSS